MIIKEVCFSTFRLVACKEDQVSYPTLQ